MSQNLISVALPPNVTDALRLQLTLAIDQLKPHVKGLSKSEREELTKMGDKSLAFATKINAYMASHPQYIPTYIDQIEYQKDFVLPSELESIHQLAQTLFEMLDDTIMAAGSDVMEVSNSYYNSVRQAAAIGESGAKAIYDDLKARYPGRPLKQKTTGNS